MRFFKAFEKNDKYSNCSAYTLHETSTFESVNFMIFHNQDAIRVAVNLKDEITESSRQKLNRLLISFGEHTGCDVKLRLGELFIRLPMENYAYSEGVVSAFLDVICETEGAEKGSLNQILNEMRASGKKAQTPNLSSARDSSWHSNTTRTDSTPAPSSEQGTSYTI